MPSLLGRETLLSVTISCTLAASAAQAESTQKLDDINVTATRTARTIDETLAPVEIITRQQIERSQAKDLIGLLTGRAGLDLPIAGGYGQTTSIYLRGTGSSQTLVLIDGIRVGEIVTSIPTLQKLPLAQIDRIEIVRGPRSSLYGADAIGGVIQIFTRQGEPGINPSAVAAFGTNNTIDLSANLSGGSERTRFNLNASHFKTDGINAIKLNNPDRDGYRNDSLGGSFSHAFASGQKINLQFMHAQGETNYDGFDPTADYREDFVQQTLNGKFTFMPMEAWDLTLSAGESRNESDNYTNDLPAGEFNTRRLQAFWQNDIYLADDQIITAGLDYLRDELESSVQFAEARRDNKAAFAQYQGIFGAFSLTAGARRDDNEAFGGHTTGNVAVGYDLTASIRTTAAFGTGFKAPDFSQLYWPFSFGFQGNPDLKPEESKNIELGLKGSYSWGGWSFNLFQNDIENLIQNVFDPVTFLLQPENVAQARIRGLETSLDTRLADWDLSGSLTLLDPRDRDTDEVLLRRARKTLRLDADRQFGASGIGISLIAQDSRTDQDFSTFPAQTVDLAGYALVNLRASHRLSNEWIVRGQIKNLLDKEYETVKTYNSLGREVFVSIAYAPK
ncbi:TonB-dependent receptor domain-containing protein [endosymbiont of Lamellibrachia barhami]|uniref:TonB-dependent receptor domain-containing protein n=1 Tax=endosymbiont of Lamellibrachia barhami TaxID=205975 RepID=UPI0015B0A819|nr:TonB-dependent receptor [endosymbiont of Lamellibrachia barhami]